MQIANMHHLSGLEVKYGRYELTNADNPQNLSHRHSLLGSILPCPTEKCDKTIILIRLVEIILKRYQQGFYSEYLEEYRRLNETTIT